MRNPFLTIAICVLLAAACSEPAVREYSQRSDRAAGGVYVLDIPDLDSGATYDFTLFGSSIVPEMENLELRVQWLSPSGKVFSETVYMKELSDTGSRELYRKGVSVKESGAWRISIRPVDNGKKIAMLGIICEKVNGTR